MADASRLRFGFPFPSQGGNYTFVTRAINDTTSKAEWVDAAIEAMALSRIGFLMTARAGTPPLIKMGYQSVSSGAPSGTYLGGGSPASVVINPASYAAGTWNWVNLDNTVSVARGDVLGGVIEYSSGTADGSNNATFAVAVPTGEVFNFPYGIVNASGVRTNQSSRPVYGYGSASAAYGSPLQSAATQSFNSGSTPDEYGLAFTVPSGATGTYTVAMVAAELGLNGGHTTNFTLYENTTALQSIAFDTSNSSAIAGTLRQFAAPWSNSSLVTLTAGTEYIVAMAPGDSTNQSLRVLTQASASDWAAYPGRTNCRLATRTNGLAWSYDATKRPMMAVEFAAMTASGGGSVPNYGIRTGGRM